MKLPRNEFIRKWIKANLIGMLVGVLVGPILFYLVIRPQIEYLNHANFSHPFNASLFDILSEFFVWAPIGVSLGVVQQNLLRAWKIKPLSWIIATSLGFGLPTILIAWVSPRINWMFVHSELGSSIVSALNMVEPLIVVLTIGALQVWLLRNSVTKPSLWIWSHIVGVIVAGILSLLLFIVAFAIADPVEKFFYAHGLDDLVYYRDGLMMLVIALILPFGLAIVVGWPTGLILQKYSKEQNSIVEVTEEKNV